MNLRRLRYFVEVARLGNVGEAAKALHIAQPSLSQQIRVLENELGVALLVRSGRGIALTPAGVTLATEGRQLIAQVDHVITTVREISQGRRGELRVGLNRSFSGGLTKAVIDQFRTTHPLLTLTVKVGTSEQHAAQLRAGELDVAFIHAPVEDASGLALVQFDTEELVAVLPSAHRLARRRHLTVADLQDEPLVWWPREDNPALSKYLLEALYPTHPPTVARVEPDEERIVTAVRDGVGISFVTRDRVRAMRTAGVRVKTLAAPPRVDVVVAWDSKREPAILDLLWSRETSQEMTAAKRTTPTN